jgi:glycerol-3-phosphate acyltransferase PlsX
MPDPATSQVLTIALDTMGADFSPKNEIAGAVETVKEAGSRLKILLIGRRSEVEAELAKHSYPAGSISVADASEVITMEDEPVAALRSKRDSSIVKGFEALKSGAASAFVSAGNTGAVMGGATLELGRIKGVTRPMIGAQFPRGDGSFTLVFDVGATVDAKAQWLKEYAIMGTIYAQGIFGIANPSVALLSVGEEEQKGNELVFEATKLLKETKVNFIGNVEGRDVLKNTADIILCDGFTGNVILKFAESVLGALKQRIRDYAGKGFVSKLKAAVTASVLKASLKDFDYQEHGGVPLLGVNGVVIIGHGSSSPKAIKNMILRAEEMVRKDVTGTIRKALEQ